jgi:hypothetical protein
MESGKHIGHSEATRFFTADSCTWIIRRKFAAMPSLSTGAVRFAGANLAELQNQAFSFPKYLKTASTFMPLDPGCCDDTGQREKEEASSISCGTLQENMHKHRDLTEENEKDGRLRHEAEPDKSSRSAEEHPTKGSMFLKPPLPNQPLPHSTESCFTISPSKVMLGRDSRTTCMIKNIPNKYTQRMLIGLLNEDHYGVYDFVYLRMDFQSNCNVGYAFVNFIDVKHVYTFYNKIHGMGWRGFSSGKIAELTYASIQGFENLRRKFRRSNVMNECESYRPKIFYTSGPHRGQINPDF